MRTVSTGKARADETKGNDMARTTCEHCGQSICLRNTGQHPAGTWVVADRDSWYGFCGKADRAGFRHEPDTERADLLASLSDEEQRYADGMTLTELRDYCQA